MALDPGKTMALQAAICDVLEVPMATRWYVVAEVIDEQGEPSLMGLRSPGLPIWVASGMLRWEADGLGPQPAWTQATD